MKRSELYEIRRQIERAASFLPNDEAESAPALFPTWAPWRQYAVGYRLANNDRVYRVLQAHTSQPDWTPDVAVSLYVLANDPDPAVIPDWVHPGATNPYMRGDKVRHVGKVWESAIDYNVWEPGAVGSETLWTEVEA